MSNEKIYDKLNHTESNICGTLRSGAPGGACGFDVIMDTGNQQAVEFEEGDKMGGHGKLHKKEDISQCLESGASGGGGTSNRPMVEFEGDEVKIKVIGNVGNGHEAQNVYDKDGLAPTVREMHGKVTKTVLNKRIRRLTPVECARLQGFPDDWHKGVSDSQAYRCYGNAVTVDIVTMIAKRLWRVK